MDRHLAADLDAWLTTEPDFDDDGCTDINGYPEHDYRTVGAFIECRWCGAPADDD